ncbi:MAG TPA: hypothetical protein VGL99_15265 [Chloroflexota bacterium]|jgi:hypothetical protein
MTAPETMMTSEHELRRQIDRSLSRALFDRTFAEQLLTDPAAVLGDGCTPQQQRSLLNIRATSLRDFARQAQVLFWLQLDEPSYEEDMALPAAAAI